MKKITPWVGAAFIIVIIFATFFGAVQQVQRSDADYPQVQLAQDAAAALNQGAQKLAVTAGKIDMGKSLASFVNVYDREGKVVAGSGLLDGEVPQPSIGMLTASDHKDYSRVTWSPKAGVRVSAVTVSSEKYYVVSGRSLKVVEKNSSQTLLIAAAGAGLSLFVLAMTFLLSSAKSSSKKAVKSEE